MARSSTTGRRNSAWEFARGNALTLTLFAALLFGCLVVVFHGSTYRTVGALLWSLGFSAAGVLLGFLFAVPRPSRVPVMMPAPPVPAAVANGNEGPMANQPATASARGPTAAASSSAAAAVNAGLEINTNLMEISDWLTKIIVGVGLVELKELPTHAESLARFMAPSLHDTLGVPLAGAIMLYFSVLGFLGGYLLTRIYISQWFRWADEQTRGQVQLESGRVMDVDELTRLQQPVIEDLQQQVAALFERHAIEGQPAAAAAPSEARPALRILWADDRPQNNTLQVNMLEKDGHRVDTVLDTAQALAALQATHYDVLITDMHRIEGGKENPVAGLELLRTAKERQPQLAALVFCSRFAMQRHGEDARRLGADLVTDSGTALLAMLRSKAQGAR
ncbi:response regulator [Ramlibacter sp. XY19]|uniref:response regulator n=1 Tax=Ramlibacter paludis TaxID=2908000 RepID=UPI0023DB3BB3|nr:response regulator [Ramlibacter paludis]MCG2594640.1 response regulator [Ramlibacter paludis]